MTLRLLDLFCGAGGAGEGYRRAGFDVVGVDNRRRRCGYPPGEFIKADALEVMTDLPFLRTFDLIHASPPCQTHTRAKHLRDAQGKSTSKVDLIPQTRNALAYSGVPYVIENVPGAPVRQDLLLCGSMFDHLYLYDQTGRRWLQRHRVFELSGLDVPQPACDHKGAGVRPLGVYATKADNIPSGGQTCRTLAEGQMLMGIDWMPWAALVEAIPPAYTEHIGRAFLGCYPVTACGICGSTGDLVRNEAFGISWCVDAWPCLMRADGLRRDPVGTQLRIEGVR